MGLGSQRKNIFEKLPLFFARNGNRKLAFMATVKIDLTLPHPATCESFYAKKRKALFLQFRNVVVRCLHNLFLSYQMDGITPPLDKHRK